MTKPIQLCQTPEELADSISCHLTQGGARLDIIDVRTGTDIRKTVYDEFGTKGLFGSALNKYNELCKSHPQLPLAKIDTSEPLSGLAQIQQLCMDNKWNEPQGEDGQAETPNDLIDLAKAVELYHRSRAQLKRDIEGDIVTDYRKTKKGKHWISRSQADNKYIPK